MERVGILFIVFLVSLFPLKYDPPSLYDLAFKSEIILLGEIISVDEGTIEVRVVKSINYSASAITIQKFEDWICGKRWGPYKKGQQGVFFLRRMNDRIYPMGGGNEGEMPVHEDKVYMHATTLSKTDRVKHFESSRLEVDDQGYNNPYRGYAMDLEEFWEAAVSLKKCFTCNFSIMGKMTDIHLLCSAQQVEDLKQKNPVFRWAVKELQP
ncbi:hypothetical protein SAMN06265375_101661 [Muriicola jejuensis]|uniref:Uncharacterized protein n=1 Tax=Muriicola jejuensis TaxID=504488 RepID=A0A6P0UBE2_9FLAO|nr:hypothetical protein [Muriicola jejuensis]NER09820.1 hypothetical protein [Muriicola jejuensis]SMP05447.1 hypothetical protein SAMN06265375_101661 [Muriicola jejuensis]